MEELKNSIQELKKEIEILTSNVEEVNANVNNIIIQMNNEDRLKSKKKQLGKKSLYRILQKTRKFVQIIFYNLLVHIFKCEEKRILLASNTKSSLHGNLLYIYDELKNYDYDIKILLDEGGLKKIKYRIKLLYYVATSKYILIDDFFPVMYVLKIRKGTKFIQVWHALGAYKKVGYSRTDIGNKNSITHKNYTDTIVSSDEVIENYAEAFGISRDRVHALGIPRTDLFFNQEEMDNVKKEVYKKYHFLKGKRVILFAPTFRGKGRKSAHYPEEYINLDMIYKKLDKDDIFILKLHPFTKNKLEIREEYKDKIIDLHDYCDINDLLLITDLLITDYSSVIFEYAFLEKPIIFYVPDLDEYDGSRSFYYDYEDYMYGTVAKNCEQLVEFIANKNVDINTNKLIKFKERFLNRCDGNSSKRFVDEIILGK